MSLRLYRSPAVCVFLICIALALLSSKAYAQHDSTYYTSYKDKLTGRFYFSKKYTNFRFSDPDDDIRLRYSPNTTLNMGVGATYRSATLNLAYGFNFLNPERGKGDTKYLDLQGHVYGQKLVIDFFGQFYYGFYLRNRELRNEAGGYIIRPDIRVREYGGGVQYMTNHRRFSYRAGFLQNDWQKRSAGTWLFGWQITAGRATADSTIVPPSVRSSPSTSDRVNLSFFQTGPSAGGAYTLVINRHFFVMASATMSLVIDVNELSNGVNTRTTTAGPNFSFKAFTGYNSEDIAISLTFTNDSVNVSTGSEDQLFTLNTGNVRLNFVHRFDFHPAFFKK